MKNLSTLLLFSCLLLWNTTHAAVRTTLKLGEVLHHSSSLCSAKQKFCLKFATVGSDSSLTYLVVDNTESSTGYVDWIANRNDPIANNSGVLTLNQSGSLIITRQNGDPIALYSPFQTINFAIVTLSDSGNLILQELNADGSKKSVLWQSFDHPADILLPGMKLGVNHRTGESWSIVSSVSTACPASGSFTLEWEPRKGQLVVKRQGKIYWTSGLLRNKRFENIPEKSQLMYEFFVVSNEDEEYFSYTSQNDKSQWVLFHNGQLMDTRVGDIARADACYGYNTESGCQKWEQPVCRHPGDRFEIRSGYFDHPSLAGDFVAKDSNVTLTAGDCKAICWTNCSCVGFTTYFSNGTGCKYYHGTWEPANLISADVSVNILVRKHSDHKDMKRIGISASVATGLIIICLAILCLRLRRNTADEEDKRARMENKMLNSVASDRGDTANKLDNEVKKGNGLRIFSYASIMAATNRFSSENKLGEGGFGPVYKGKLSIGKEVAIKRLSKGSGQGPTEFKNELTLISELQHMNLVQLLGCCTCGEERMLVYEYMPNKSLDFFLFDSTQSKLLDWQRRFNIIDGIAQGLLYLHKYSRLKVVHRDLKASNILLDENMNPKISDFGMARIFMQQETEVNTRRIVGTYGYMSPEYAMGGIFSFKSDVYSFGVLLLEILSGRRNNSFNNAENPLNLVGHAWELWKDGQGLQLVDPSIKELCNANQALRCIHVGLLCVEESAIDRPNMSDIIYMLTNESARLSLPKKPAFYSGRKNKEDYKSPKYPGTDSVNHLSISNIYAR